jgi:hypothetical protein
MKEANPVQPAPQKGREKRLDCSGGALRDGFVFEPGEWKKELARLT